MEYLNRHHSRYHHHYRRSPFLALTVVVVVHALSCRHHVTERVLIYFRTITVLK